MELQYNNPLIDAGLSPDQAIIYELLIKLGQMPASDLTKSLPNTHLLSRPQVYKVLDELITRGLVEKHDPGGKVASFLVTHPDNLSKQLSVSKQQLDEQYERAYKAIPQLTSLFNLTSGRPGVQYFEGMSGVREVLRDALTAETDIYSYVDIELVEEQIGNISEEFAQDRRKLGLKKKNIGIDTPKNRMYIANYYSDVTEERLIKWPTKEFGTVMQIYNNKVSYFTLGEVKIGMIITDVSINTMHRTLFEYMWEAKDIYIPQKL